MVKQKLKQSWNNEATIHKWSNSKKKNKTYTKCRISQKGRIAKKSLNNEAKIQKKFKCSKSTQKGKNKKKLKTLKKKTLEKMGTSQCQNRYPDEKVPK